MKLSIWRTPENRVYVEAEELVNYFVVGDYSQSGLLPQFERNIANDQARTIAGLIDWLLRTLDIEVFVSQHQNTGQRGDPGQLIAEFEVPEQIDADDDEEAA